VPVPVQLAALTVDGVQARVWQQSKDGEKGTNAPKSVYDQLVQPRVSAPTRDELDDFDRWYAARFNRNNN